MKEDKIKHAGKRRNSFNKFAIISLILGVISVIVTISFIYIDLSNWAAGWGNSVIPNLSSFLLLIFSLIGFSFGIAGLWSDRWKIAIVGVILCILILIPFAYYCISIAR